MEKLLHKFERMIVLSLMLFMMLAVLFSTIEVGVILVQQLLEPPFMLLNIEEMLEVFGIILMVVIGLELLETIRAYLSQQIIHVEVVLLAALVAVVRKIIILDYSDVASGPLFGIAALVFALAVSFFIIRRTFNCSAPGSSLQFFNSRRQSGAPARPEETPDADEG